MAKLNVRDLSERIAALRVSLLAQIERAVTPLDPAKKDQRIKASRQSFQVFLETYLPHYFVGSRDYSELHLAFFGLADRMFAAQQAPKKGSKKQPKKKAGIKAAWAAPRGNAKTSLAKAMVIYALVFDLRHFVVLISDALDQAVENLEAVKIELEGNPRLRADFPDMTGEGPVWNQGGVVTNGGAKLKAYGSGKRLRGATHGVHRPDLVVIDDLENDENVTSPAQRQKGENWVLKSVAPLGPPDGSMDLLVLGTVLHYDAVLVRLMKNPGFESRLWRAIQQMPARQDLWDEYERLYWNDGAELALGFYGEQKVEMEKGAQVLWPQVQDLRWLMTKRAENKAAFASEYQNAPIDEAERVFDRFHYYDQLPPNLVYFGAVDPSLGGANRSSDPSAIIVLGRDGSSGKLYVAEAVISKIKPALIIKQVIELQAKYHAQVWAVETVQFQEFFKDELVRQSVAQGVPVPARGIKPTTDKGLRIESLQPHTANGVILFNLNQQALIDQLTYYPKADHDDGPDALQMAFSMAYQRTSGSGLGVKSAPARTAGQTSFGGF